MSINNERYIFDMGVKIDFYPGAHGNFLEMLLHTYVLGKPLDLSKPLFNADGACHTKYDSATHDEYQQEIGCLHYSVMNIEFDPGDRVIEIHIQDDYKLIVAINNYLRTGNQKVDLYNLNKDSLKILPKTQKWLRWLETNYGERDEYPRSAFRTKFYGDFSQGDYNQFNHRGPKITFPHEAFFDPDSLRHYLGVCADFLGLNLKIDNQFENIWREFMERNQGIKSQKRCQMIFDAVRDGRDIDLSDLNVVEEAWIVFRLFPPGHVMMLEHLENFPTTTGSIIARR